ncbi:MAG TPA: cupredoxin domain-containing protein [Longimicrobiaceae bacterium]|nr:cupredoxin domain-containing protein [Longimicrobiaceae bacterium]
MTGTDWLIIFSGMAAIAWVNWYFFIAGSSSASAVIGGGGLQQITVKVAGGYDPANIQVKRGMPVKLVFDRQETSSCSEEVVLPDFGIRKFLPAHKQTSVEFTPEDSGSYEFTCGMGMLRGRITVEDEKEG